MYIRTVLELSPGMATGKYIVSSYSVEPDKSSFKRSYCGPW